MRILLIIIATLFLLGSTVSFATIPSTKSRQQPKIGGLFAVSRRQALFSGAAAAASPSHAATVRIKDFPGLEYLEPIYELRLSVKALQSGVQDPSRWPLVKKRLDTFFGGGLLSERNYYGGLSFQYINAIKYDLGSELKEYIKLDQEDRRNYMESTLNALEVLQDALGRSNQDDITYYAQQASSFLDGWFAMVPMKDIKAVDRIFKEVQGADTDHDGKLSASELATLPAGDRNLWRKRVDLVGE